VTTKARASVSTGGSWGAGPGIEDEFEPSPDGASRALHARYRELLEEAGWFVASPDDLAGDACPCCGKKF